MPSAEVGGDSVRVPPQDRIAAADPAQPRLTDGQVFARAIEDGNVWVSGLGVGANSADVTVLDPEWRGGPDLARRLFYSHLGHGRCVVHRARLVPRWAAAGATS